MEQLHAVPDFLFLDTRGFLVETMIRDEVLLGTLVLDDDFLPKVFRVARVATLFVHCYGQFPVHEISIAQSSVIETSFFPAFQFAHQCLLFKFGLD